MSQLPIRTIIKTIFHQLLRPGKHHDVTRRDIRHGSTVPEPVDKVWLAPDRDGVVPTIVLEAYEVEARNVGPIVIFYQPCCLRSRQRAYAVENMRAGVAASLARRFFLITRASCCILPSLTGEPDNRACRPASVDRDYATVD